MEYRGYKITSDNRHYWNGVHAAMVVKYGFVCWFDTYTTAIEFIRVMTEQDK